MSVWQAQQQAPTTTTILNYPNLNDVNMTLTRQGNDLAITVNDAVAGHIDITNVFNAGQMWFGFDGQNEWILNKLNVSSLDGGSFTVADSSATIIAQHDPKGLQVLATQKRSDFIVGAAMALGPMTTDPQYANVALDKNMFGSFTPENEMKMINLQPKQGVYSFSKADAMIQLAQQNGINTIHGHTLVFGEANPAWLNALPVASAADKAHIEQIMIDHITTVVKHFGDKVTSWDVVNEPLADYDEFNPNNGQIWRNHKWYQSMGRDFIVKAIVAAHQANPNARLFINEFGLEQDGERWDTFMAQLSWLKQELTAKGVPIEKIGIGMQAHVYESGDVIPAAQLQAHMRQLAALGFKVQISEMDVYTDDGDAIQGQQYADVFMACLNEPNCVAWRAWILSDRYNVWKEDEGSNAINFGKDGLFDTSMQPRPGVIQIQQRLQ